MHEGKFLAREKKLALKKRKSCIYKRAERIIGLYSRRSRSLFEHPDHSTLSFNGVSLSRAAFASSLLSRTYTRSVYPWDFVAAAAAKQRRAAALSRRRCWWPKRERERGRRRESIYVASLAE